jgi:hypothetical protein
MLNDYLIDRDIKSLDTQERFILAVVYSVNQSETAVTLLFDGADTPTQKYYKVLTGAWPLQSDDRVVVLKMSGTYVVVGKIGGRPDIPTPSFIAEPNTVFAGPATGSASAEATFRVLTQDDIPGGGGMETVVVSDVFTPVTNIDAESKIAICGKYGHLLLSVIYKKNITKEANSSNLYKIGTVSSDYCPSTRITKNVSYTYFKNSTSGTDQLYTVNSCNIIINEDGIVYVDVVPSYSSSNPNPRDKYVYDVGYLLP